MDHSTILKERPWRMFLKAIGLCLVGYLLAFGSSAWATPPRDMQASVMNPGDDPVIVGETKLVPVLISIAPQWKSASIRFEVDTRYLQEGVNPASVQSETVEIDTTLGAPFTVYVPVKVTGEGLFTMKGVLHFQMTDGKKTLGGVSSGDYLLSGPGIFSFDGEVFFGGHEDLALQKKADRKLRLENLEIANLLKKKQEANKGGTGEKTFSKEEDEKLRQARTTEIGKLLKLYYDRYPIKPEPKTKALSQPLAQGSSVTLEVNWPIDSSYTSFGAVVDCSVNNTIF